VLDTGRADLIIDVGAVRFTDAMGIRVLIQAAEEARNADGGLVLRRPSPAVRRLLGLLQLTGLLPVEE
jgi:anti-anti-sigma factor